MSSDRGKALNALKILGQIDPKCLMQITEELLEKERESKIANRPENNDESNERKVESAVEDTGNAKISDELVAKDDKPKSTDDKPKESVKTEKDDEKPVTNDDKPEMKDEKPIVKIELETKAFIKLPFRNTTDLNEKKDDNDDEDNKLKSIVPKETFNPFEGKVPNDITWSIPFSWQLVSLLRDKGFNLEDCTYTCLVESKNPCLYHEITKAGVSDTVGGSLEVSMKKENVNRHYFWTRHRENRERKKVKNKCELSLGLGLHGLTYTPEKSDGKSESLVLLHSNVGEPTVDNCGVPVTERYLVLFVKGKNRTKFFKEFFTYVFEKSRTKHDSLITMYRWSCRRSYWRNAGKKMPRKMESVVLPRKIKKLVDDDVRSFLGKKTEEFYAEHGIPYKRSYLFRGIPGSGKTSFIEALAGVHNRNLCQLMLSVPLMTDDMFATCISTVPSDSVIVLEDVDSLFDAGRKKENRECPLTFSAILNGLDGLASPYAQLIIMTTNYPNRLDPALVRSGRVDVHIEFKNANRMQMEGIFLNFYPEAGDLAKEFASKLGRLSKGNLSMATIQQHFVRHMCDSAKETIAAAEEIIEYAFQESQSCAAKPDSVYN